MKSAERISVAVVICTCLGVIAPVYAQLSNTSSVLDGCGIRSSGGSYANLSAAGQPGGIAESGGGRFINQAGFLNTFQLRPGFDSDADGVDDELDADNDNDGLTDTTEVSGSAFTPPTATQVNQADSDGDGQADGAEVVSGTDPTNPAARLVFRSITPDPSGHEITWLARGNHEKVYVVRAGGTLQQPFTIAVFSNTVPGGSAPWYAVDATISHTSISNALYYVVEVLP